MGEMLLAHARAWRSDHKKQLFAGSPDGKQKRRRNANVICVGNRAVSFRQPMKSMLDG